MAQMLEFFNMEFKAAKINILPGAKTLENEKKKEIISQEIGD